MAGATTRRSVPYAQGSDPLCDLDAITQGIAEAADESEPMCVGTATCVVGTANTDLSMAITFPAGRFPVGATIKVYLQPRVTTMANPPIAFPFSESDTGFTLYFRRATASNFTCHWLAVMDNG